MKLNAVMCNPERKFIQMPANIIKIQDSDTVNALRSKVHESFKETERHNHRKELHWRDMLLDSTKDKVVLSEIGVKSGDTVDWVMIPLSDKKPESTWTMTPTGRITKIEQETGLAPPVV